MSRPSIRRNGERLSVKAVEVMKHLSTLDENEWMPLNCHARIIYLLMNRDYVDMSKVTGQPTYKLSLRGREALAIFAAPPVIGYQGEMCARCGDKPRHERSGAQFKYCVSCLNDLDRERRQAIADKPCPRCGKPRDKRRNGLVYGYCADCRREKDSKTKARLAERVRAGEVVFCTHCHERPVMTAGNTVYNECAECRYKRRRHAIFNKVMRTR